LGWTRKRSIKVFLESCSNGIRQLSSLLFSFSLHLDNSMHGRILTKENPPMLKL
jgi:hypothetical protein